MAVMNGFRAELLEKILGLNGHVIVHNLAQQFTDFDPVAERIGAMPGVVQALPIVEGQAMISTPQRSVAALVRGLREADARRLKVLHEDPQAIGNGTGSKRIVQGSFDGFDQGEARIAIGSRMAKTLDIYAGDRLTMVSPRGASTPFGTAPRVKQYEVAAVFEIGMAEYDRVAPMVRSTAPSCACSS